MKQYEIIGLEETWITELTVKEMEFLQPTFNYLTAPATKKLGVGRPKGGLLLLVKKHLGEWIYFHSNVNLIFAIINVDGFKTNWSPNSYIAIMVYYSPPYESQQSPFQEIEKIYSDWSHLTTSWIILGDFNARIGNEIDSDYTGFNPTVYSLRNSNDNEINKKGKLLINWVKKSDLFILNGRMKEDYPGRHTFISAAGTSVIDYIICTESVLDQCVELRVLDNDLSDHFPVTLMIKTNVMIYKNKISKEILTQTKKYKYNTNKFEAEIGNRTALIQEVRPDQIYSTLIKICNEYIIEQSPQRIQQSVKMKNKFKQEWFDLCCYRAKKLKEYYLTLFRKTRSKERLTEYISAKRTYNNLIKAKKRSYYNKLNRKLLSEKNNNKFFWSVIKKYHPRKKMEYQDPIGFENWYRFFKKRESSALTILDDKGLSTERDKEKVLNQPIVAGELVKIITKLRESTAVGPDLIPVSFLKRLPINMIEALASNFNYIYNQVFLPEMWHSAYFRMIFKKGEDTDPKNYRPIAILSVLRKIFTSVLVNRFEKWTKVNGLISNSQFAFVKKSGTEVAIFILLSTIQIHLAKKRRKVYVAFLDLEKAFDSISVDKLCAKLEGYGADSTFTRVIRSLFGQYIITIKSGLITYPSFEICGGLLQGDPLSPYLFNFMIHDLDNQFMKEEDGIIIKDNLIVHSIQYADDVVLISPTKIGLQRKLNLTERYFSKMGLKINPNKTHIVVFRKGGKLARKDHDFYLLSEKLKVTEEVLYLGVLITSTLSFGKHIQWMKTKAYRIINNLISLFVKMKTNSIQMQFRLFSALVINSICYALPLWGLDWLSYFEKIQLQFIRKIYGLDKAVPGYAIRHDTNRMLLEPYLVIRIMKFLKRLLTSENIQVNTILKVLKTLAENKKNYQNNWYNKLRIKLASYGLSHLLFNSSETDWNYGISLLVENMYNNSIVREMKNLQESKFHPWYKVNLNFPPAGNYIHYKIPFGMKRFYMQIRLNSFYIIVEGNYLDIRNKQCKLCNDQISVYHIISMCKGCSKLREQTGISTLSAIKSMQEFYQKIFQMGPTMIIRIYQFIIKYIKMVESLNE